MAGSRVEFTADDLRIVIGLCELDHKVTDLIGPRSSVENMVQHRYRVSSVASKANIKLMELQVQREAAMRLTPTPTENGSTEAPANGSRA